MSKKDCTNCKFAEWDKTKTGRRKLTNGNAVCHVKIDLPLSYADYRGDLPCKSNVGSHTCKYKKCSFWKLAQKNGEAKPSSSDNPQNEPCRCEHPISMSTKCANCGGYFDGKSNL